jgi:hypothetical protein
LYWIVDNVLWLYILLGFAAVALFYLWWVNRRRSYLIALGVVVVLIAIFWVLSLFFVSDRQQIQTAVYEMADAITENKPENAVKHLSRDFQFQSLKKADVHDAISKAVKTFQIDNISVRDIKFVELSRSKAFAKIDFLFYAVAGGQQAPRFRCEADFVLEEGKWRMKTIKFFKGFTGSDQEYQIPGM